MKLGEQIKKYRSGCNYSQEELSEKLFVSRQTISNWENNKSYPDIQSLLLISSIFNISLDELVKGDLPAMKNQVLNNKDRKKENIYSWIMLLSFLLTALSIGPILLSDNLIILCIPFLLLIPALYCGYSIELFNKSVDIKTYSEILAYTQGKNVDELRKQRNKISYFFEQFAILTIFIIIFVGICVLSITMARFFM
ncbi:transcriptional regulator [Leuconostoc litchii]|uniref:XRE family transcriptional regulator n=1 Tax=Leuconostoc litchii TaxID=1981069 RepID=A0A652NDU8_9LACO|nr:helix-turn-helix transcriptional regulator [Leuconostoc litchii]TYC46432.1 XRE family transcriptional regulator [Leuconostoc litchii]GMA70827.1 transcriptional regulator [Leuconostoc litchii]GMA70835.1 transcriptional regulator [Leuconostoc litchii]